MTDQYIYDYDIQWSYLTHKRRKISLDNIRNYLKKFVGFVKIENSPEEIVIYSDHTKK